MILQKPDLEIVTHCWSGLDVPIYHRLLQLQLSSLVTHQTALQIRVSVCYTESDRMTSDMLAYFSKSFASTNNKWLNPVSLPENQLFKRCIGRNILAKQTQADVVWFTDCDHIFYDSSLDDAYRECLQSKSPLIYPQSVWIHKKHRIGDALIHSLEQTSKHIRIVSRSDFVQTDPKIAIGGIQVVKGDFCRERGYMDRWKRRLQPSGSDSFEQCLGDKKFRSYVGSSEQRGINGVFRVRHSRTGRDQGQKDHSK